VYILSTQINKHHVLLKIYSAKKKIYLIANKIQLSVFTLSETSISLYQLQ